MVTKLAELAIVLSLVTLSQRLTGYENKPLGYFLLLLAVIGTIHWLWVSFGDFLAKNGVVAKGPAQSGRLRTGLTTGSAIVLLVIVAWPWLSSHLTASSPGKIVSSPAPTSGGRQTETQPGDLGNGGFLQLEKTELIADTVKLSVGKGLRMNYHFFNRGERPVSEAQAYGFLMCVDQKLNSDDHMKSLFKKAAEDAYAKWHEKGPRVAARVGEIWDTANSDPLTGPQLKGLIEGTQKIYFLVYAIWKKSDGVSLDRWDGCSWVSKIPKSGNLTGVPWRNCQ